MAKEKEEVSPSPREAQEAKRDAVNAAFAKLRKTLSDIEGIQVDDYELGLQVLGKAEAWFSR